MSREEIIEKITRKFDLGDKEPQFDNPTFQYQDIENYCHGLNHDKKGMFTFYLHPFSQKEGFINLKVGSTINEEIKDKSDLEFCFVIQESKMKIKKRKNEKIKNENYFVKTYK